MQKLNAADDPRFSKDKREKQPSTLQQYACSKENVQVLLEVEVIGSLYAAMSKENNDSVDQSGIVEVTIIRPETADSFMHFQPDFVTQSTVQGHRRKICEFQYCAKPYRRPATGSINRCRIPHLDRRQNQRFFPENLTGGPAINVKEIVGDLPSKVTSKPRIITPEKNGTLHHGDHYGTFNSHPEISNKVYDTMPCINPFVYHVHLEAEATDVNCPLVELSAANKILEAYDQDEPPPCIANDRQKLIEAMRRTLREWGSDEKRIADALHNDNSSLMRCEHCGVISFKKTKAFTSTVNAGFAAKVDNVLTACDEISRNQSNENTSWSRTSTCFTTETETLQDKLKMCMLEIKEGPKNTLNAQAHDSYHKSDTRMFPRRTTNAESINEQPVVDTMMVQRGKDTMTISKNPVEVINIGRKKDLKTVLPSVTTNNHGRSPNMQKKEKPNYACSKTTYSSLYSPRQIFAKTVEKPATRETCPDTQNRNKFRTLNNGTKNQNKNSTLMANGSQKTKAPNCNMDNADNNAANDSHVEVDTKGAAKSRASSLRPTSRKNKLCRSLVPRSNIPMKLEKTNPMKLLPSKNVADLIEGKPCAIVGEGKQNLVRSRTNEDEFWLFHKQTLLGGDAHEDSHDEHPVSSNLRKNLLRRCNTSFDDKSSSDREYGGKNDVDNMENDQRSFRSMENRKCDQISPDFNCSAPTIGCGKKISGDKDFDHTLENNNLLAQNNEESETTAFSSSSSENAIREWANSLIQVQRFECEALVEIKSNDDASSDTIRSIRTQIDKSSDKCSTYNVVVSEEELCSKETLTEHENSLKLDGIDVFRDIDHPSNKHKRITNTSYHNFSADKLIPPTNAGQPFFPRLKNDLRLQELISISDPTASTFDNQNQGKQRTSIDDSKMLLSADDKTTITVGQSDTPQTENRFDISDEIIFTKQKYVAISRTSVLRAFNESSNDPLNMTYKNSASVISSSSEYSNEHHQDPDVPHRSLCKKKNGSVLQIGESEKFERQITYDEFSSKCITAGSNESLKAAVQPALYRKILESKDEMDWETFQQLVGSLHPSQRELWSDICKAVSNEARRVAGETGASTEVCIEINPMPTSQAFSCGERRSRVKTSGNEITFEMDMILTDSESFLDQKSHRGPKTVHGPEKCG